MVESAIITPSLYHCQLVAVGSVHAISTESPAQIFVTVGDEITVGMQSALAFKHARVIRRTGRNCLSILDVFSRLCSARFIVYA